MSQWNTEDKVISEILHQFFLKTKDLDKLMTPEDLANDLVSDTMHKLNKFPSIYSLRFQISALCM